MQYLVPRGSNVAILRRHMGRTNTPAARGQIGLGTLVVFVSMVIVASIAAGVLINAVAFQPETTGAQAASDDDPDPVRVIAQRGTVVADGQVRAVNLTVTTAPGADPIDLRDATVSWVGPRGAYSVAHRSATDGTGGFAVAARDDPSGAAPVLDDAADRLVLRFDLGSDDDPAAGEFGAPLGPGDMASVTITTGDGASTTTRIAVPRSPGGADVVL